MNVKKKKNSKQTVAYHNIVPCSRVVFGKIHIYRFITPRRKNDYDRVRVKCESTNAARCVHLPEQSSRTSLWSAHDEKPFAKKHRNRPSDVVSACNARLLSIRYIFETRFIFSCWWWIRFKTEFVRRAIVSNNY